MIEHMPTSYDTADWNLHTFDEKTYTLSPDDENYCSMCTYIIGVDSGNQTARYYFDIEQPTDLGLVEKTLRFGINQEEEVKEGHSKWYTIIIEKNTPFTIHSSVSAGSINIEAYWY
jgi:hypothetical protein